MVQNFFKSIVLHSFFFCFFLLQETKWRVWKMNLSQKRENLKFVFLAQIYLKFFFGFFPQHFRSKKESWKCSKKGAEKISHKTSQKQRSQKKEVKKEPEKGVKTRNPDRFFWVFVPCYSCKIKELKKDFKIHLPTKIQTLHLVIVEHYKVKTKEIKTYFLGFMKGTTKVWMCSILEVSYHRFWRFVALWKYEFATFGEKFHSYKNSFCDKQTLKKRQYSEKKTNIFSKDEQIRIDQSKAKWIRRGVR